MRVQLAVLLLALSWANSAHARDPITRPITPPSEHAKHRPGTPGGREADAAPADDAAGMPDPDQPAEEPVTEGVGTWVDRIEGDVPPQEAEEIQEVHEEQLEELRLIDRLASPEPPVDFYANPKKVLTADPLHLSEIDPKEFDIPITVNPEVEMWMRYFTGSGRKYYERWLSRSTRYRPMMYEELEKEHLPRDLVYLSMIESGYSPHAYSSADAAGLWQFISSTGRVYHLRIDYWVDERADPELATKAALDLLGDLHGMFGDWYLAWASYNTGPGRVKGAVAKAGTTDFFTIARGPYLHPETENYVPKIIAAAIIGHHPERYGFDNIAYQPELTYDTVHVDGSVDLAALAKCDGMTLEDFQQLNPALRRWATPPEGYDVRVTSGTHDTFLAKLADAPKAERVATSSHTVRRGETLSIIASKYDTTVVDIVKANHLHDRDAIRVGQVLLIPGAGRGEAVASTSGDDRADTRTAEAVSYSRTDASDIKTAAPVTKTVPKYHTVKAGETLSSVASHAGVTVAQVKSWNGLKSDKILVGQQLKVGSTTTTTAAKTSTAAKTASTAAPAKATTAARTASTASSGSKVSYTIKKGDSLSAIAAKYGVPMSSVEKWNKISDPSSITVGQTLAIYTSAAPPAAAPVTTKYTVRAGDSLGAIATKYGCTVAELKTWNGLTTSVIQPGQVLKVKKA